MSDIGIRVVGERILAEPIVDASPRKGILILDDNKSTENMVRVIAISDKSTVKVGDRILIGGAWHQKFNYKDKELLVILNQDILGVFNEEV